MDEDLILITFLACLCLMKIVDIPLIAVTEVHMTRGTGVIVHLNFLTIHVGNNDDVVSVSARAFNH